METMKSEIAEDKSSSADIRHFISLIRKCKNPTEISDSMFNELVDKIVVYEAEGAGNARTQKVDIYFNYVGQVDIAYNNMVQSAGSIELTGKSSLQGEKEKGIDDYTGTYTADYANFSGTEYLFGGTSIYCGCRKGGQQDDDSERSEQADRSEHPDPAILR